MHSYLKKTLKFSLYPCQSVAGNKLIQLPDHSREVIFLLSMVLQNHFLLSPWLQSAFRNNMRKIQYWRTALFLSFCWKKIKQLQSYKKGKARHQEVILSSCSVVQDRIKNIQKQSNPCTTDISNVSVFLKYFSFIFFQYSRRKFSIYNSQLIKQKTHACVKVGFRGGALFLTEL